MDRDELKKMIRDILNETDLSPAVKSVRLASIQVSEQDRLDTGNPADRVYTHDLFTLAESPRLGAGLMEMRRSVFAWTLEYDEIDYVIEGKLSVLIDGHTISAGPGEVILIPKGSRIEFSAPDYARFLYVTYPADWQNQ